MEMLAGSPVLSRPGVDIGTHAGPEISLALCSCSLCPYSWDAASSAWVGGSALSPPITHPAYFLQATAMHSDCIFKKEQAMCLEKIQRANDLLGLNDSFPGEFVGMGQVRGLGRPSSPSTSRLAIECSQPLSSLPAGGGAGDLPGLPMVCWSCPGSGYGLLLSPGLYWVANGADFSALGNQPERLPGLGIGCQKTC